MNRLYRGRARSARRTPRPPTSIPRPSRSILRKAVVVARVLVPLAHLAAGHHRRLDGDELDQRRRLEMTIPPGCWEMWRGKPAISAHSSPNARQRGDASFDSASGSAASSSWTRFGLPSVRRASRSRPRRTAGRGPSPGRGSRRASGRWRSSRRARRARDRTCRCTRPRIGLLVPLPRCVAARGRVWGRWIWGQA